MVRKLAFSFLGGVLVAGLLILPSFAKVNASACDGYCADRLPNGLVFDGCSIQRNKHDTVISVICSYGPPQTQ